MFHRELKINYGTLGGLISSIESYQSALSVMKQSVEKIWELLEESSGEAYEGLEERKETILGQISSCEGELTDLHDLLAGYSYDMQSVIAPVDGERTMVVDRNDIWFNMQSILSACDRIAAMVYNVNVPWLGTTYTAFAKEEVKEKETKYYNKLEEVQQKIQKKYQDSIAGYKDELVKLYEDKVVVYENTDDVYASKVSKDYYPKYTSLGEGILNVFEWLGDAVTGFVGGVIEGVIGVIDGIGEFLFGIGEFAVSECVVLVNKGMGSEPPDWALKNVKETKEQVGAILDDPMLLVEGMAQGISDTYESEGIWYCAGYAVGTYAGTKGIAEAGKAVKGKVKVKGKVGESGSKGSTRTVNGFDTTVNTGKQGKHIIGNNNYIEGRSVFNGTVDDAQRLVDEFAGTGEWIGTNKERVNFGEVIGQYINPATNEAVDTTVGIIHYSKTGTHIVPAQPIQ